MGNNKKAQKHRQRKSKEECLASLKSATTSVTEMISYMPGLGVRSLDMEKAILAAPDYNYYEKLQLRYMYRSARDALTLLCNTEQARSQSVDSIKASCAALREQMVWLIITAESINSKDTGWSDLVSAVLQSLHDATDAAGDYGPAWLEYSWDDVDDALEGSKAAAAAQLEREGLAVRRKKMFTATRRRRWQALEMQMSEDKDEAQEIADEEAEAGAQNPTQLGGLNPMSAAGRQPLDSSFHAAAMSDATTYVTLEEERDMLFPRSNGLNAANAEGLLSASAASSESLSEEEEDVDQDAAAAAGHTDVYTSMAADLAEYEAEIAARQQQQQQWEQDFPPLAQQQQQQQQQQSPEPPPHPPRPQSASVAGAGRGTAAAGRGGAGRGRGDPGPNNSSPTQQQQQQQQRPVASKTDSAGPPPGWTPEFAGTTPAVARSSPPPANFEPCFRNEDFMEDDAMPNVDNLTPVITQELVAMEAIVTRMKFESVVFRRGRGSSLDSSTSRTGASVFLTALRTDPDMSVYERVMVTRWWRSLNPLAHHNPATAAQHTRTQQIQQILQEQYNSVRAADAWIDSHLGHLMPHPPAGATQEQQESTDRLHKAASVLLEAFQRNQCVHISRLIMELHLDLPQPLIAAEPGHNSSSKVGTLAQRTITQLVTDGLCRREVVGRNGWCVICQLLSHEWRRANGFLART